MNHIFIKYVRKYKKKLLEKRILINLFAVSKKIELTGKLEKDRFVNIELVPELVNGDIVTVVSGKKKYDGYVDGSDVIVIKEFDNTPPFRTTEVITISPEKPPLIANWDRGTGESTIGRYLLNYTLLASIFGDKIPYVNEIFSVKQVEKQIANMLLDGMDKKLYDLYMLRGYALGHTGELFVPTLSEKSITTDPKVKAKREELIAKFGGADNLTPEQMVEIESELKKMDRAWIAGDSAEGFHDGIGSKSWDIHRKKMFLTGGGVENFGSPGYTFIETPLAEGWNKEDMPIIANDIRKASQQRGAETAKGGEMTKFVLRVLTSARVSDTNDCGTKRTLLVPEWVEKEQFVGSYVVKGAKIILLTNANVKQFNGTTMKLRSPLYCIDKEYCHTCAGAIWSQLGMNVMGALASKITSTFMLKRMKAMHGKTLSTRKVNPIDFMV